MRSRRNRVLAATAAAALLALAGCKGNSSPTASSTSGSGSGSTQQGLTPTTVTIGTIASITGPVPGLFQGAIDGVKAYVAYINSQGGVNGRTIIDDAKDDALSCSVNSQASTQLASTVFAMVGSFSIYDSCSEPIIAKNPSLPYVALELNTKLGALPNVYSPQPTPRGWRTGAFKYIMKKYGVSRIAFLSGSGSQEVTEADQFAAAKSVGATVAYQRYIGSTESDFTSDIIRMRKANVDWVNLGTVPDTTVAHFLEDMNQQNWHPKVVEAATAYDGKFLSLLPNPKLANGVLIDQTFSRFLGEDASSVPAVKTFNTWVSKTSPGFKPDLYTMYGWVSAELFVQALKSAGANPTQAAVINALKNTHSFNAGGILAHNNPGAKVGATCWMMIQIENGKFNRITPSKGFRCKPGGYYNPS